MSIIRTTLEAIRRGGGGHIDVARVDAMTDADIARQIAEDPDVAPEMSDADRDHAEFRPADRSRQRA
jgi:hypothetical protein